MAVKPDPDRDPIPRSPNRSEPQRRCRRRGRPPLLSREAVLDAAMARLDAAGVDAVTIRGLAADLGVSPMALYGHVTDKDELLLALVDRLADRLMHPALPDEPRTAILTRWQTLYDGLAEHPWLPEVLARRPLMAGSVLGAVEDIPASLVRAGMTLEQAIRTYRIVWEFTLGALLVRAGARDSAGPASAGPASGVAPGPSVTYAADLGTLLDGLLAGAALAAPGGAPDNPEASA